ncbi:MAG TPA: hypothetical protein DCS67_02615 [Clostridiales bacterium UBA8960]|nr:hypothetical protein [Clostridiales bacterium UBA8960]
MTESLSSKALEANLAQTQMPHIELPEVHKWLLERSSSNWDIHKRTETFLRELNHPYRNDAIVIEMLHEICLSDLWFYEKSDDAESAYRVFADIFGIQLARTVEDKNKESLIRCLAKYVDRLASLNSVPENTIRYLLKLIEADFEKSPKIHFESSRVYKMYLDRIARDATFEADVTRLVKLFLMRCYAYWDETTNIEAWFESKAHLMHKLTIRDLDRIGKPFYLALSRELDAAKDWDTLHGLMSFNDISNHHRRFAKEMDSHLDTFHYLYFMLRVPGMAHLETHLIYDINRNLRSVFGELDKTEVPDFIAMIMSELKIIKPTQGGTVLDCIATLGREVIGGCEAEHQRFFVTQLIDFGFDYPGVIKLNNMWRAEVNVNHIKQIRTWLDLICIAPSEMRELLSALIVNLKLGGIFISDTDLFQRDVTKLLNADITPVYREIKQLAKLFPIYFRDIGAEGKLREYSTALDELSMRQDHLIHFLRKQIHTESNNTHIGLIRSIVEYWLTKDIGKLKGKLPSDVMAWIQEKHATQRTEWVDGVNEVMLSLAKRTGMSLETHSGALHDMPVEVIEKHIGTLEAGNERDRLRVMTIFKVHALLCDKYSLEASDILEMVKSNDFIALSQYEALDTHLKDSAYHDAIYVLYEMMAQLKSVILSPEKSTGFENIFYKRHVAAGIPSMYGQYIEPKFEALGLIYRLEKTVEKLLGKAIRSINLSYMTAKTLKELYAILELFKEGLALDGIVNETFNSRLTMFKYSLTSPSFSYDQYVNIFQFMARDVKQIIEEYFIDAFDGALRRILPNFPNPMKAKEHFYKDHLFSAFLIGDLDHLITEIISVFDHMRENYSPEMIQNMMTYSPSNMVTALDVPTEALDNQVFLGTKAFFMKKLYGLGFPVPDGFILTTEVFRHKETIKKHKFIKKELDAMILKQIRRMEKRSGKRFGDPENPLILSVRSGATFSMPGAMQTFLNVGMNFETAEAMSRLDGQSWTAWDSYRRFIQSYGMALGIEREAFERVMKRFKALHDVELKAELSADAMRQMSLAYHEVLKMNGFVLEQHPLKQLNQVIYTVLDSWFSSSASVYRKHMEIAEEWGTAVLVQNMVMGNRSPRSGTGVLFTNSPFERMSGIHLYGDFVPCSQGEDVVSGLVNTFPISEQQRKSKQLDVGLSLESDFPQIYGALLGHAKKLIDAHGFVHQEIEFTFESDAPEDLYILQVRNQKLKKLRSIEDMMRQGDLCDQKHLIGRGLGVGSGVMTGSVAFDEGDLSRLPRPVVLIRPYTVPDDIPLIFEADAVVTAKGGLTSHAAVTAVGLGKVCVVNCKALVVDDVNRSCSIGGHVLRPGDLITVDGSLGKIYIG